MKIMEKLAEIVSMIGVVCFVSTLFVSILVLLMKFISYVYSSGISATDLFLVSIGASLVLMFVGALVMHKLEKSA